MILAMARQYLTAIVGVGVAAVTLYGASVYYSAKLDKLDGQFTAYRVKVEKDIADQTLLTMRQTTKLRNERDELNEKLTELTNEKFKTHQELQEKNRLIRDRVVSGTNGLRVNAICPAPSGNPSGEAKDPAAAGVANGETTVAIIDPRTGGALVEITNKGDKYKSQLEALQAWVDNLITENNK